MTRILFILLVLCLGQRLVYAQISNKTLRTICTAPDDLFVICKPEDAQVDYSGYDVELFRKAGTLLTEPWIEGVDYEFKCVDFPAMLDSLTGKNTTLNCTAGLGGITVTKARIQAGVQFSYPTYRTSVAPLVRSSNTNNGFDFFSVFTWQVWVAFLLTIPAFSLLVFALEYVEIQGKIQRGDFLPGLKEASWRSIWTMFVLEPFSVSSNSARFVAWVYGAVGVIFVNIIQGKITATLTVRNVDLPIRGPEDLVGKAVETLTPYVSGLKTQYNLQPTGVDFQGLSSAAVWVEKLRSGELTAVLVDEPLMQSLANNFGCDLQVVKLPNPMLPFDLAVGFASSVADSVVAAFSRAVEYMQEDGTLTQLTVFVESFNPQCQRSTDDASSVEMSFVYGLWIVLAAGVVLGLLMLMWAIWRRNKKNELAGRAKGLSHSKTLNDMHKDNSLVQYRAGIAFKQKISMFAFQLANNKKYLKAKRAHEKRLLRMEHQLNRAITGLHVHHAKPAKEIPTVDKLRAMCDALNHLGKIKNDGIFVPTDTIVRANSTGRRTTSNVNGVIDTLLDEAPLMREDDIDDDGYMNGQGRRGQVVDDSQFEG